MSEYHARIPGLPKEAVPEIAEYLQQAFGNRERIDYGSGHEASFATWLCCFHLLGLLTPKVCNVVFSFYQLNILLKDHFATVSKAFNK